MIIKKKLLTGLLASCLMTATSAYSEETGCSVWGKSPIGADGGKDSFGCAVAKGLTSKFTTGEVTSVIGAFDPLMALANFGAKKLWGKIWPQPNAEMDMLKQILQTVQDIEQIQRNTLVIMKEDFTQTDALITAIIAGYADKDANAMQQLAKNSYIYINGDSDSDSIKNTGADGATDYILQFVNNTDFQQELSNWRFPPIPAYVIIAGQIANGASNAPDVKLGNVKFINEGDYISGSKVWETQGDKPYVFKIDSLTKDAVIEQGGVTSWSFRKVFSQIYPLSDATKIEVSKVTFTKGILKFDITGDDDISNVQLGMTDSQIFPYAKDYTQAIFQSDGSISTFYPKALKINKGTQTDQYTDLPWSDTQVSLFTQEVFSALNIYEKGLDKAPVKEAIEKGLQLIAGNEDSSGSINILSFGNNLNQSLLGYSKSVQAMINETAKLELNDGYSFTVQAGDDGSELDLNEVASFYYKQYGYATTALSNASQIIVYAYFYDPDLLANYGLNLASINELHEQFTNALKQLNATFISGLQNFSTTTTVADYPGDAGNINFNMIPNTYQMVRGFTNNDIAPMVYIPFTVSQELKDEDIKNYISIVKSGNLDALVSNTDGAFVCALVGDYYASDNTTEIDCAKTYSDGVVGSMGQYNVVRSLFGYLNQQPDNDQNGSNFATIALQNTASDSNDKTTYTYAIVSRFEANTVEPKSNRTYWDLIVNDNFVIDDTLYDGYLTDVSEIGVSLPSGNWSQYCKIPELFNPKKCSPDAPSTCSSGYKDPSSPLVLSCSPDKKVFKRQVIYPSMCIGTESTKLLEDINIDYDNRRNALVCGGGESTADNEVLIYEGIKSKLTKSTLRLSAGGDIISGLTQVDPGVYRHNYVQNYTYDTGRFPYRERVSSASTPSNKKATGIITVNDGGYIWSDYPTPLWPSSIKGKLPDGNWQNYCSQPLEYKDKLITECGHAFFILEKSNNNGSGLVYNFNFPSSTDFKSNVPPNKMYVTTDKGKVRASPFAKALKEQGLITSKAQENCALSVLGLEAENTMLDFYCRPADKDGNLNKNEWVKSTVPFKKGDVYDYKVNISGESSGKITVANWSGICPAYDYEVLDADGYETVFCAQINKQNQLERVTSPKAKEWQQKKYLGSSIYELCDLSALGQVNWIQSFESFKTAPDFYCHGLENGAKTPKATWTETGGDSVEDYTWPEPDKYTEFAALNSGEVAIWHTPVTGAYQSQCKYIRSAGKEGQQYPEKIYATCGGTYNDAWSYANNCTPGSNVVADEDGVLHCTVEAGSPKVIPQCKVVWYQKDKPDETTVECDIVDKNGQQNVTQVNEANYNDFIKQSSECDPKSPLILDDTGKISCYPKGELPVKLPDACSEFISYDNGTVKAICGDSEKLGSISYDSKCSTTVEANISTVRKGSTDILTDWKNSVTAVVSIQPTYGDKMNFYAKASGIAIGQDYLVGDLYLGQSHTSLPDKNNWYLGTNDPKSKNNNITPEMSIKTNSGKILTASSCIEDDHSFAVDSSYNPHEPGNYCEILNNNQANTQSNIATLIFPPQTQIKFGDCKSGSDSCSVTTTVTTKELGWDESKKQLYCADSKKQ